LDIPHHPFDESYRGTPPWDIGRPQLEFVRLGRSREVRGRVLDVGCGTGENAIFFAQLGMEVWGVDSAPLAIEKAKRKAVARKARVRFLVEDALQLGRLETKFDTITDCGLFHAFSDEERSLFIKSLRAAMDKHGTYFMLCFSIKEPADWGGPRRVSEEEIRGVFKHGWKINYIKESKIETTFHEEGGNALLSSITID
jgi:cyclopropane fatty-acyl-phospholipid synthase-like methyltransferase